MSAFHDPSIHTYNADTRALYTRLHSLADNAVPGYARHDDTHRRTPVQKPGARDGTIYGRNRSATRSFFVHHVSGIAAAAAAADALTIANAAAVVSRWTRAPRR